ncbi:alanine racemase [Frigidibacter sp. ROC022]|uniref:alanine racemase n=1 Tax=Frigidibacter sp. ROC022 TaxID=2971796 RepID=UPI00215B0429|nr:alanine racemase [Frigidibacter sp. ROC022]MCR8726805.1 alanine racemase [Frigidibacter sp. ROC022]
MGTATLEIDLTALTGNWQALDALSAPSTVTAAVVKADGYGLGAERVARALLRAGVRQFFVALAEEGAALRNALGREPDIFVLSGHMPGDTDMIGDLDLTPCLNSVEQLTRHFEALPGTGFAIQLDTGMNRLGLEPAEWAAVRDIALTQQPNLIMSHLACADEPEHPMNAYQLDLFRELTEGVDAPRSLAATGGILLGPDYHFDLTRPGIGLYGGAPFADAQPVVRLSLPVIQVREIEAGESVGYGCTWEAEKPSRIATVAAGYADGLHRVLSNQAMLYHGTTRCPMVGRVSMDLITVDVTHLTETPVALDILSQEQTVDDLAEVAGTIGYEVLTGLGPRYGRRYVG